MLTDEEKKALLKIARDSAAAALRREPAPKVTVESAALALHCGAFVTLHNHGALRGCIGQFEADRPLYSMVQEMAVAAATRDPRFTSDPVTPAELADIDIEISALSPMKRLENPLDIELGRDGIYIRSGHATGCFLPQVATE
ncbi:MAG: AmmeMemoRadiSam system protein A, partial [Planctomycetia bacterium]|nr:AmmeMemoRadiSam system protein A [Planctomycetia bacterium]